MLEEPHLEELSSLGKDINNDGYYDDIPPAKEEVFPVSKGEFIAKIALLILLVIVIALYLIYVIS